MKGGGTLQGGMWVTRAKALKSGDHIKCLNWSGEIWMAGEINVVVFADPLGFRDGFWRIRVYPLDCPPDWRVLQMKPDDRVHIVARDVPMDDQVRVPKQVKNPRPKKGEQLKLF